MEPKKNLKALSLTRQLLSMLIVIANEKGGPGKTSLSRELGFFLASLGNRVCFLDIDAQANLTHDLTISDNNTRLDRITAIFRNEPPFLKLINDSLLFIKPKGLKRHKERVKEGGKLGELYMVPGDRNIEVSAKHYDELSKINDTKWDSSREALKWYILHLKKYFDFIIVDTPPSGKSKPLNRAVAEISDFIVSPVDGPKAGKGISEYLSMTSKDVSGREKKPGFVACITRCGDDFKGPKDQPWELRNYTWITFKPILGPWLSPIGAKEKPSSRTKQYDGSPTGNPYTDLCHDIVIRIDEYRRTGKTIFDDEHVLNMVMSEELSLELSELGKKLRKKEIKISEVKVFTTLEEEGILPTVPSFDYSRWL